MGSSKTAMLLMQRYNYLQLGLKVALVKPAVYAKGGDYTLDTLPEAKIVQSYGGEVAFIDLVEGRSTTNIIEKIKEQ